MDPLFWILAGVVSICVIGIVVLWLLERQATRQLAAQGETSARLPAVKPRNTIEEVDTIPIPATSLPPIQRASRKPSPAPPPASGPPASSASAHSPPGSRPSNRTEKAPANRPEAPFVPIQVSRLPAMESISTTPLPTQEPAAPAEPPAPPQQEQLQTTPERAMLRAAELARERRSLEHLLEDNQARLDTLLRDSGLPDAKDASTVSLLQSEIAGQRERLQEIIFLEQSYRQVASPVTEQVAQQKRQVPPDAPKAFGVRRHPLAPIKPPERE